MYMVDLICKDIDNFNTLFTDVKIDYNGVISFDNEEAEIVFRLRYL